MLRESLGETSLERQSPGIVYRETGTYLFPAPPTVTRLVRHVERGEEPRGVWRVWGVMLYGSGGGK